MLAILSGCGRGPGDTSDAAKLPERIVVVGTPLYTEILFDLGAGDRVVGLLESPDNPPEAASIPKVGSTLNVNWSLERVLSLRPDLVLGSGPGVDSLERAGIPVVSAGGADGEVAGIEDVFEAIRIIDRRVNGNTERADPMIRRIRAEIDAVTQRVRGRPRPRAAFFYSHRQFAPVAAGKGTPEDELLRFAGAGNVFADIDGYRTVNLEELILRDPDVIVTNVDQVPRVAGDPGFRGLRAVESGRVFGVRSSKITSSRFPSTLKGLAAKLHPAAFPGAEGE